MHVGAVVQNVGSIADHRRGLRDGAAPDRAHGDGDGPRRAAPSNLIVPVGTRLGDVLEFCGGLTEDAAEIIFGGPMMGAPQSDLRTPLIKGTTGIVVLTRGRRAEAHATRA